jgi:hypothetical protein
VIVEVLTIEDCPHGEPALELARAIISDVGVDADVRLVFVERREVEQRRFLGSPSLRVDGNDIEPGAELRTDYSYSCRLYRTSAGAAPLPDIAWIREKVLAEPRL